MKNLFLHIIIIAVSLLLYSCAGMSKDENAEILTAPTETERSASFDDAMGLEKTEEKKLAAYTAEQKEAFQLRAIQKFQDFVDYIKIISNRKVDDGLKEHSIQLSTDLFINDSTLVNDSILNNTTKPIILNRFLTNIQTNNKPIYIKVKSIAFTTPIASDSLNSYKGNIEAKLRFYGNDVTKNIEVYIVEIKKDFGDNTQVINEVRLGNIY